MTTPNQSNAVRDVTTVIALLVTACVLALTDHPELAATALGGALGVAMPGVRHAPVPGVVLGIGAAALLGGLAGCAPGEAALAHKVTCDAARVLCHACDVTSGGEHDD